jgi:hypothetical protein
LTVRPRSENQPKESGPRRAGSGTGRTYLYVPFEERDEAQRRGAVWDPEAKCWYIDSSTDAFPFREWLGDDEQIAFAIESEEAYIAAARTSCWKCHGEIDVICLYCEQGLIGTEPYTQFSVSNISATDVALEEQLKAWPMFRRRFDKRLGRRLLTNHCGLCGAPQTDHYLHCEPGGAFFMINRMSPGGLTFVPLVGRIQLDGDEGFAP